MVTVMRSQEITVSTREHALEKNLFTQSFCKGRIFGPKREAEMNKQDILSIYDLNNGKAIVL